MEERIRSLLVDGWHFVQNASEAATLLSASGTEIAVVMPDGTYFRGERV
jgi:hypothetical protein